ncbi:MAG: DUF4389 domain-containing protein [Chloroflexi bacterium]|nr:DUF4389 domain-containing protein [Chloroflexota bacterium]
MTEEARFCAYCGASLVAGAAFCQQCGRPVAGQPVQEPTATGAAGAAPVAAYPVRFEVDYPERLGRLSTVFRIVLFIPVAIFLALVGGQAFSYSDIGEGTSTTLGAGGGIVLAIWAAVIVRQYVPHWLFDFQVALMRFQARAYGYLALLTDRFPAFEGEYPISFDVSYPDKLNRWKVAIWKIITSIPHFIILIFLYLAAFVVVVIAWFAILFTGRFPKGLHTFVAGTFRWSLRVQAYIFSLTDDYPPFSLE